MTKNNKINWAIILGVPGALLALISIFTSVVSKDFRCGITHFIGIKSDQCSENNIILPVKLRILTEAGEPIDKAEVDFIGNDAVEIQYTDRNGLVEGRVKNEGSVKISIKANNYPEEDVKYTTEISQPTIREIRLSKSVTSGNTSAPVPITGNTSAPVSITGNTSAPVPTTGNTSMSNSSIPKSLSSTNSTPGVLGITKIWHNVTFQLDFCSRKQNDVVSCHFTLTSTQDMTFGIVLNNSTKIVDGSNNTYYADKGYVGKTAVGANDKLSVSLVKSAYSNVIIDFTDVPNSVSQAFLLNLHLTWYDTNLQFRNIPIN